MEREDDILAAFSDTSRNIMIKSDLGWGGFISSFRLHEIKRETSLIFHRAIPPTKEFISPQKKHLKSHEGCSFLAALCLAFKTRYLGFSSTNSPTSVNKQRQSVQACSTEQTYQSKFLETTLSFQGILN